MARGMSSLLRPFVPCLQTALLLQSAATGKKKQYTSTTQPAQRLEEGSGISNSCVHTYYTLLAVFKANPPIHLGCFNVIYGVRSCLVAANTIGSKIMQPSHGFHFFVNSSFEWGFFFSPSALSILSLFLSGRIITGHQLGINILFHIYAIVRSFLSHGFSCTKVQLFFEVCYILFRYTRHSFKSHNCIHLETV